MYLRHEIGKIGEELACKYLEDNGYKIVERNFEAKQGEIDIIALDKQEIVFIEVKTRTGINYGEASEAITRYKKRHLLNSIKYYLYKRNLENEFIRIDVAEVYVKGENIKINYIKKAIE